MDRDRRLTGYLRGQTDRPIAPPGFEFSNGWRVCRIATAINKTILLIPPYRLRRVSTKFHHPIQFRYHHVTIPRPSKRRTLFTTSFSSISKVCLLCRLVLLLLVIHDNKQLPSRHRVPHIVPLPQRRYPNLFKKPRFLRPVSLLCFAIFTCGFVPATSTTYCRYENTRLAACNPCYNPSSYALFTTWNTINPYRLLRLRPPPRLQEPAARETSTPTPFSISAQLMLVHVCTSHSSPIGTSSTLSRNPTYIKSHS